jgi:hypothetical protein
MLYFFFIFSLSASGNSLFHVSSITSKDKELLVEVWDWDAVGRGTVIFTFSLPLFA